MPPRVPNPFGKWFAWGAAALAFSLSSPKRRRGGGRFSSPLSSSLPARSSRGEREKRPRRFSCRTLLVADPPSALCQPPFGSHPPSSRTKLSALRSFLRRRDHGKIVRAKGRRRQTFATEQ